MCNDLSFQSLISSFDKRVLQVENESFNFQHGDAPKYPPFVILLGNEAQQSYAGIAKNLFELWPQYKDKMNFVGMNKVDGEVRQVLFSLTDAGIVSERELSTDDLLDTFDDAFSEDSTYACMTMAHIYYVIDTSSIRSVEGFIEQLEIIPYIKELLQIDEFMARDSIIVLLKSDMRRRRIARAIRGCLAEIENGSRDVGCKSVFLLSNYRNDGVSLQTWDECYRMSALFMALSNCSDDSINSTLFAPEIITASYSAVEKPRRDIAHVVVDVFLRGLDTYVRPATKDLLQDRDIKKKLGLSDNGTFTIVDEGAERLMSEIVPKAHELELFPRAGMVEYDISHMTFDTFNQASMGAYAVYLNQQQQIHLSVDGKQREQWAEAYVSHLRSVFSVDELIFLGNHIDAVRTFIATNVGTISSGGVISGAKSKLRSAISRNPQIIEMFIDTIRKEAARAREFRDNWKDLLKSLMTEQAVADNNLSLFYSSKVKNYLYTHGLELGAKFATKSSVEELRSYLESAIYALIDSDLIFSAQFENELMQRLGYATNTADPFQWILNKLTGNNLKEYLQVLFMLDAPLVKSIFVKKDSELGQQLQLQNERLRDAYFYDTGSNRCVEALNIYKVGIDNLNLTERR